jgi:hypothetical protein
MRTKITTLEISLNTQDSSSAKFPTQGLTYPQWRFRDNRDLSWTRNNAHWLTALLTRHCTLRQLLHFIGPLENAMWRECGQNESSGWVQNTNLQICIVRTNTYQVGLSQASHRFYNYVRALWRALTRSGEGWEGWNGRALPTAATGFLPSAKHFELKTNINVILPAFGGSQEGFPTKILYALHISHSYMSTPLQLP